jgi:hypothetical protein
MPNCLLVCDARISAPFHSHILISDISFFCFVSFAREHWTGHCARGWHWHLVNIFQPPLKLLMNVTIMNLINKRKRLKKSIVDFGLLGWKKPICPNLDGK